MKALLKLCGVRNDLSFLYNRDTTIGSINMLLRRLEKGQVEFDFDVYLPSFGRNLQRPYVWTLLQKQEVILSLLKRLPIGKFAFCIIDAGDKRIIQVIDGKQRLSSIFDFVKGEFPIVVNNEQYFFEELEELAKFQILDFYPIGDTALEDLHIKVSCENKALWFEYINYKGVPHTRRKVKRTLKTRKNNGSPRNQKNT